MNIRAQSRSEQRRMLESAQRMGELGSLYFYLSGVLNGKRIAATDHHGRLPVLPVGEDVEVSLEWAHLLYELTAWRSQVTGLATELTSRALLEAHFPGEWYLWGEPPAVDAICPGCGGVNGCACGRGQARYAVAHKPGRVRHIVAAGKTLCGRNMASYALSWACGRRRRAWVGQESSFCRRCFDKWYFEHR